MRWTVFRKLMLGFSSALILMAFIGFTGHESVNKLTEESRLVIDDAIPVSNATRQILTEMLNMETGVRGYLVTGDERLLEAYNRGHSNLEASLATLDKESVGHLALQQLIAEARPKIDKVEAFLAEMVAHGRQGRIQEARAHLRDGKVLMDDFRATFSQMDKETDRIVNGAWERVKAENERAHLVLLGVGGLALFVTIGVALFMGGRFTRDLRALGQAAEAIAGGRLDVKVAVQSTDEIGDVAKSFRQMVRQLGSIVGEVRVAADVVASGSHQIGSASAQLAATARSQAASAQQTAGDMGEMAVAIHQVTENAQAVAEGVEETSSSIAEMTASIRQVAGNAERLAASTQETSAAITEMAASIQQVSGNLAQVHQAAAGATGAAREGQRAVDETIQGMEAITQVIGQVSTQIAQLGDRSKEIGAIVEVIDDIAEQTNLLALNAAIEAARAGEHGRGFAVVADEVRKLAERSAKATGEIASLIKGIQAESVAAIEATARGNEAVHNGTRLARSAGDALGSIVASIGEAGGLVAQVVEAAGEQARTATQITRAVDQMNALTQEVTVAVGEQAKGSEQIVRAVDQMSRMTREVSAASTEQEAGSERVVASVGQINLAAQESAAATTQISQSVEALQEQARALQAAIAFFRSEAGAPPVGQASGAVALVPAARA
ncbi:CHASE3 domain-containing protein [bacterium]|nr:CHASE3 domain-containing protein [bacterium]